MDGNPRGFNLCWDFYPGSWTLFVFQSYRRCKSERKGKLISFHPSFHFTTNLNSFDAFVKKPPFVLTLFWMAR